MPNFSIALTGLQADTVALDTIGNNLSNLNTTAFKEQTTSFEDLFYQNIGNSGSGDTLQVGVGVRASATTTDFTQGSLATTGVSPDMALNGNGFFVVQSGQVDQLTRAGDFQLSDSGALITTDGQSVLGYGAKGGVIDQNAGIVPLTIPVGTTAPSQVTSSISMTSDLDSTATPGTVYAAPVTVYDSLGVAQDATVTYTNVSPAQWTYSIALPAGSATGTPVNATGTLTFNSSGTLVTPAANVKNITFSGLTDGAAPLNFTWNLYNAAGAPQITETAGASNTTNTSQNGYGAGAYQNFSVDGNGVISATFSNGITTDIGQVAVASVTNTDGLLVAGGNNFDVTGASGAMTIGVANIGGNGAIAGESLEASNVDISTEFSDLIVAQRAFEANSKTVTTFDSVTQDAIAMVR